MITGILYMGVLEGFDLKRSQVAFLIYFLRTIRDGDKIGMALYEQYCQLYPSLAPLLLAL